MAEKEKKRIGVEDVKKMPFFIPKAFFRGENEPLIEDGGLFENLEEEES